MEKKNIQQIKRSFISRNGIVDIIVRGPRDIECASMWSNHVMKPRYDYNTYCAIINDTNLVGVIESIVPVLKKVSTDGEEVKRDDISKIVTYLESIIEYKNACKKIESSFNLLPKDFNRDLKQFELIEYTESPYLCFREWITLIWSNIQHLTEVKTSNSNV